MPFCQFGVRTHILRQLSNHVELFCPIFLGRALRQLKHSRPIFGRFLTGRIFYRLEFGKNPQMKKSKNANFQNHLKIDPEGFRYRFRVQNASRTPQVSISGHISCTRTLPADESKDEFLTKMAIFMNFNCDQSWPVFCRKALET